MGKQLKIAVFLGGPSAEREVSLKTGKAVARALSSLGHQVYEIDPQPGSWKLDSGTDVVFLALHGSYGEDGVVQRELEQFGVAYTGCDSESSRIAFDKILTKERMIAAGVPTARFAKITNPNAPFPRGLELPVVVKPVRQGSSVGLKFVSRIEDWPSALAEGLKFDTEVLVEEQVIGRETTVAILAGKPLPIVEVRPKQGTYDYQNKYTPGATEYFCPAEFEPNVTRRIQDAALEAFKVVGGRDYARVDVMVNGRNEPVVLEVNTLPGMTETSLFPKAAAAAGISYEQVCQRMIDLALGRLAVA
ncbi:MAG TPA: D-alanine--D-alanine ligase [Candidatus Kapabacteria bacterium]|nr:D-alanine--D-alanine ligase [Candidatus Kapabacteria bacterium]